jgi:capsular exopolysaccharide synthesis family protein
MTRTASEWMNGRLEELRDRLVAAEERLQAFREQEQLVDMEAGIRALPALELNETTQKLVDARRELSEAESTYRQLAAQLNAPLDRMLAIPAIKQDPLVQQFRQARATADLRVAELSKRYGPRHPKMIAASSERDSAERALASQVESVKEAIRNQYEVSRSKAAALEAAMATAKTGVQLVGRKESRYRELTREAETSRQLYDLFYQRASETQETVDLVTANARVIEPAVIPLLPSAPNTKLIAAIALALALVAGVALAFLREMMDNTVRHRGDVEQKIGQSILGIVPLLARRRRGGDIARYGQRGDQSFEESIRTVRTGISLSRLDNPHKLIMVTSAVAGEGKTTIASNLALAFSQLGRVLLIDADLRRPSVATQFGIDRQRPGLTELCDGSATAQECILRLGEDETLDLLTAGGAPSGALELLESKRFRGLLTKLTSVYDRIIIDCPPVLPVSDALVLANQCDALVFVVKADSTPVLQVNRALQQLRRCPALLTGVVLNQVDVEKLASYGDYGGGYYDYGSYVAQ